ncbi:hypothetical protein IKE82_00205 [Candidatus Saccharibacteria bacterium]|nr:hypothetical protein [Candidatus Saccharibacteria bacterium]
MYLAVLGRQPEISIAELEALFHDVHQISHNLATFSANSVDINRLGGCLKIAQKLPSKPLEYLQQLPEGKITLGISDYSTTASPKSVIAEALKLKQILVRHHRSVRVVANRNAALSTAASLHNGLGSQNPRKVEFVKFNHDWYRVIGVQDIDAYTRRDQARPARDARVGMLPPKLAQILINLCGPLPENSTILDPFCGTGVVLQEALLMGYHAYGTDLNPRMVEYTSKNLTWLTQKPFFISQGDATSFKWQPPINAVACETYLGQPMSQIPSEIKLKSQKQKCQTIILGFLRNLISQIDSDTPVVIAAPAWLRQNGTYERLEMLAFLEEMGYNVNNKSREGLLYRREGQIVARDILILRKN